MAPPMRRRRELRGRGDSGAAGKGAAMPLKSCTSVPRAGSRASGGPDRRARALSSGQTGDATAWKGPAAGGAAGDRASAISFMVGRESPEEAGRRYPAR